MLSNAIRLFSIRGIRLVLLGRATFESKTVADIMQDQPVTTGPGVTLSNFVDTIMLRHAVSFVPVLEDATLLGHMNPNVLAGMDREHWGSTRVGDVFVGLDPRHCVPPQTPILDLMTRISQTGRRKFLVVKDQQLVGVITLSDLARYLERVTMIHQC